MIGFLRGRVAGRTNDGCFIDVGGVGYRLICSTRTLSALPAEDETVKLFTHTHVREDLLALFGFHSEAEQTARATFGPTPFTPISSSKVRCSASE